MFETDTATPTVERSPEFETFRRLVRQRAIMARDSQGWPIEHLNETLVKLGLDPIEVPSVSVTVTARNTYLRTAEVNRRGLPLETGEQLLARVNGYDNRSLVTAMDYSKWEVIEKEEPVLTVPGIEGVEPDPIALGDDLTEYKRLVRRVGIQAATVRGWCESGTNEYLEALGLARKQTFRVPVEATVVQRFTMDVTDAESLEEARAMVSNGGLTDPLQTVRNNLGANVREVVSTQVPPPTPPSEMNVGDPDTTLSATAPHDTSSWCRARNGGYYCTLEPGHEGHRHVAGAGRRIEHVWDEQPARV